MAAQPVCHVIRQLTTGTNTVRSQAAPTREPYILILSVSMGVLAIMILAFSMRRGCPMPKL
jgi:hypothetical protein